MKANSTQQEILLITGTSFSAKQWCKKDDDQDQNNLTETERLEEACWNGLLQEMLPEICLHNNLNKKLYLWQIKKASSFIELEIGEIPEEKEKHYSIDPYLFMPVHLLS